MGSRRCNFELNNFHIVEEDSQSQFATLEFDVCRSGGNTHRMPISKQGIRESATSIKGKPILAAFRFCNTEFGGHDEDEIPLGFFVEEEPTIVEKEYNGQNELFLTAKGKIWKRYFQDAMDIFRRKGNKTDVSMEIDLLDAQEPDGDKDGYINLFSIMGCTLLGVNPAIDGSEARVLSFAEMKDAYNKEHVGIEKFALERKEKMSEIRYKVNKTELKDTPWGDVDKTAMRNKIMKAINKASLVKDVYALVEDGWQDAPSEHLKYPIMQLVGDTFYYNRGALSSALAYAKQEGEQEVITKVQKLYKKFKLDNEEGGEQENMADVKKNATEVEEQKDEKNFAETEEMQDETVLDNADDSNKDEEEVEKAKENLVPDDDEDKGSDDKAEEFADDSEDMSDDEGEAEMSEGDDEEDMCDKMSLDVNVYAGAMLEMLKAETEEERQAAKELGMSDDEKLNIVMEECFAIAQEFAELKQFKCDKLAADTEFAVKQILAEVRPDLPQDKYAELEAESKNCSYDGIEQFKTRAQAFAYQFGIQKVKQNNGTHIYMGFDNVDKDTRYRSVFEEILSK